MEQEDELSIISPTVLASWKRSRAMKIDVENTVLQTIGKDELNNIIRKRTELIDVALPYLHKLYKIIKDENVVISLTDEHAVVLESIADEKLKNFPNFPRLGTIHREEFVGTNGIGTAVYTRKPLQLSGAAHWLKINHNWHCSTAPIFINNEMIGTVNLATPLHQANQEHTLGLVVMTTNAIGREVLFKRLLEEHKVTIQQQKEILEVIEQGIITVDSNCIITQTNQLALNIFYARGVWEGRHINELIEASIDFQEIMEKGEIFDDVEVSVKVKGSYKHVSFSIHPVNHESMKIGLIISLRPITSVRKIWNKASGARAYYTFEDIISKSKAMEQPIRIGHLASKNRANVLITGDSGTGKELMAQAIHNASDRRNKPFVAINCGALSRELIQSELFGYEGGAFTGAKTSGNMGKFELADRGTLFLDEIAELPLESQVNFLRVLQTNEVIRIGAKHPIKIDVRIIAATNKNLRDAVKDMTFRDDLFYRLNVLSIHLPSLRDRIGDIRFLCDHLVKQINVQFNMKEIEILDEVYQIFESYLWPGNVREMENVLQRAILLSTEGVITPEELPPYLKGVKSNPEATVNSIHADTMDNIQCERLIEVLREQKGNVRKCAIELGLSRGTLYNLMRKYAISLDDFR